MSADGDRPPEGILESTAVSRRIDAGLRHRTGGTRRVIPRQDRPITCGDDGGLWSKGSYLAWVVAADQTAWAEVVIT